jgi:hypothetical protein
MKFQPYSLIGGFITGARIKEMASISLNDILIFQMAGSISGIEICDNNFVDLSRPGAESFRSKSA